MKPARILWDKVSDAGTFDGGSWAVTLPLGNLTTQDVQEVARSVDAAPASTWFRVDFGRPLPVSLIYLGNHNGSIAGRRQIVIADDPDGDEPAYDSGLEPWVQPTEVWGARSWGGFSFDGIDPALAEVQFDLSVLPRTVYGRYLLYRVHDPTNPAGYIQAGRFMAGDATPLSMAFGVQIRPMDPSEVRRTRGGLRLVRRRPAYRTLSVTFEHVTEQAAWATGHDLERRLGKAGDMLFVYDPDDGAALRSRRVLHCALSDTVGVTTTTPTLPRRYGWGIQAEEIG